MVPKQQVKKFRVQASSTTNTYVYCWITAQRALEMAKRQEAGALYFRMTAGVFAAFTVEAFLNHLGQWRVDNWRDLERSLGPREKLIRIQQDLHLSVDRGRRPYQTLDAMLRLRDSLAHGKTVTTTTDVEVLDPKDESANYPEPEWKHLCVLSSVTRMVEDAEAIVRDMSGQAGIKRDPLVSPGHSSAGASEIEDE